MKEWAMYIFRNSKAYFNYTFCDLMFFDTMEEGQLFAERHNLIVSIRKSGV